MNDSSMVRAIPEKQYGPQRRNYLTNKFLKKIYSTLQKVKLHPRRESCPNTEFFMVRVFLIREYGKNGPEKTLYLDTFHTVINVSGAIK